MTPEELQAAASNAQATGSREPAEGPSAALVNPNRVNATPDSRNPNTFQTVMDSLTSIGDAATMYTLPAVQALMGGAVIPGTSFGEPREGIPSYGSGITGEPFRRSIGEEFQFALEQRRNRRARLEEVPYTGGALDEVTEGVGAFINPFARGLDRAAESTMSLGKGIAPAVKRMLPAGAAGATVAGAEEVAQGNEFDEIMEGMAIGAIGGSVGQALLGEAAVPALQRLFTPSEDIRTVRKLLDRRPDVVGNTGITPENLRAGLRNMGREDNILSLEVPTARDQTLMKFYQMLADQPMASVEAEDVMSGAADEYLGRYHKALAGIRRRADATAQEAQDKITFALGQPRTPNEVLRSVRGANASLAETMNSLSRVGRTPADPEGFTPLGAETINLRSSVDHVRERLIDDLGLRTEDGQVDFAAAGPGVKEAYNTFVDSLRTLEEEQIAGGVRRLAVRSGNTPENRELNELVLPEQGHLATLYNSRQALTQNLRDTFSGNFTPAVRAGMMKVLKAVDEEITHHIPLAPELRAEYAANMRVQDAYSLGKDFYQSDTFDLSRNTTDIRDRAAGATLDEWMNLVGDDEAVKEAFGEGFSYALNEDIGKRSFNNVMNKLVGRVGLREGRVVFEGSEQNRQMLNTVLGKERTDALLSAYDQDTISAYTDSVIDYLENQVGYEKVDRPSVMGAVDMLNGDAARQEHWALATWTAAKNALGVGSEKTMPLARSDALMRYINAPGDETRDRLTRALNTLAGRSSMGAVSGAAASGEGLSDEERRRAMEETEDYLRSIGID